MNLILSTLFPNGLPDFDIVDNPFAENITAKRILYPTNVCGLTNRQHTCLQAFLASIGESCYYLSDTLALNNSFDNANCFDRCQSTMSFKEYDKLQRSFVTVLFSEHATWGIVISDNEYAIVGTTAEYAEHMYAAFAPCYKEQRFFLNSYVERSHNPAHAKEEIKKIVAWL